MQLKRSRNFSADVLKYIFVVTRISAAEMSTTIDWSYCGSSHNTALAKLQRSVL